MDLTDDDVLEILNLIEQSHFDFFRLESGDLNLTVSKGGYVPAGVDAAASTPQSGTQNEAPPEAISEPEPADPVPPVEIDVPEREGLEAVTATMVGTFYRAPEPGAAPFVEVGSRVDADATVGLVEVMKVFTSIAAGITGTIAEIVVSNAQFVEMGEVLFFIAPDDAPGGGSGRE